MKIAVVTDSVSYLSAEDVAKYDIHVVPVTIIFGDQTYKENIDMTQEEFYERMRTTNELPSTSQVSIGEITAEYDKLAEAGYDAVISIHLSSGITSFIPNLEAYLPEIKNIKVYPFDSKVATIGEGNMVRLAGKLVQEGKSVEAILEALTTLRATTDELFVVDDLSHLVRTGRLSNASAFMGNMLRIKPLMTFEDGRIIALNKERTMKRAYAKIKSEFGEKIQHLDYPVWAAVIDANNPDVAEEWYTDLKASFPGVRFERGIIGPVVGVHTGEKTLGLVWSRDIDTFN